MDEAEWLTCREVDKLLLGLAALNATERKSLLFVVAATRSYEDPEDDLLLERLEGYADKSVTRDELSITYRHYKNGRAFRRVPFDQFQIQNAIYLFTPSTAEQERGCRLVHDIFGNPFRPVTFDADWRTSTAAALAQHMYDSRDFSAMPILADALQDAGCENAEVLDHCRGPGPHVRGCWVVDLVLGKS
jgi:hypothetical protein